jgi:MFS family permease
VLGRALRHKNYRLFFAGQSVSLIGTWLSRVATSWLVYRLSHSAFLLGVFGFASQIPTFFLAPVAGVWVDRANRHRVLIWTQVFAMLQSLLLAAVTLSGIATVGYLVALGVFQGFINAFDMPARQSFLVEMIESREDLPNAIALNSSMVNAARLLGPSIAGILIAAIGEGFCFLLDAVSYLAVIGSLLAMKVAPRALPAKTTALWSGLKEGALYVAGSPPIRAVLLLLALVSLVGVPYSVLMPIFASEILHGGAHTLGWLMGLSGFGALLGALYLALRKSVLGLGKVIGGSTCVFGVGLCLFAHSRAVWLSLLLMVPVGLSMMVQMAASNTILQTIVDDDKRGRLMGFYGMALFGMAPFGSLLAGGLAGLMGAPATLVVGGLFCILGGLLFFRSLPSLRMAARPIYIRLGIIPAANDAAAPLSLGDEEGSLRKG